MYIGIIYYESQDVPQNYIKAEKYYKKAAEFGNIRALRNIAVMHSIGRGVKLNDVTAYMYWCVAAALGDEESTKEKKQLQGIMTPAQISEGDKDAERLLAKIKVHKKIEAEEALESKTR